MMQEPSPEPKVYVGSGHSRPGWLELWLPSWLRDARTKMAAFPGKGSLHLSSHDSHVLKAVATGDGRSGGRGPAR